jgi:hypothetical protein
VVPVEYRTSQIRNDHGRHLLQVLAYGVVEHALP